MSNKKKLIIILVLSVVGCLQAGEEHLVFQRRIKLNGLPEKPFIVNDRQLHIVSLSGSLYRYSTGGKIRTMMSNLGTVIISPVSVSNRILVINSSNRLTSVNPIDSSFQHYQLPGSTAIISAFDENRKLFFGTDDHILYGINLNDYKAWFAHYIPHLYSLSIRSNILNAKTWDKVHYQISTEKGVILRIIENSKQAEDTDIPLLADRQFELTIHSNNLYSRMSDSRYALEFEGLNSTKSYKAFRHGQEIFLYSFDGEIICFKIQKARKPVVKLEPRLLFSHSGGVFDTLSVRHRAGQFIVNDRWIFKFPSIDPSSLKEVQRLDLNADGFADLVLLFNANTVLKYVDVLLFLTDRAESYKASLYSTVGNTNFEQIFLDLDGDKKKEMVIVNEAPFNLSKDLDKRILIPDIYTMTESDFVWDSYNYPGFYQKDLVKKKALAATRPFELAWENNIWVMNLTRIIALENELYTIKRQIASITARDRNRSNKIGLSLWFYKKGVEFYRNNWDNLALLCFRNARANNPNDVRTLYQISQIYNRYGLFNFSLDVFINSKAPIPYVSSLDLYAMVEKLQDVVLEPGQFQISYNLGNIYFSLGYYRQAITYYERALKVIPLQSTCLKRLVSCYMILNTNDKKALEYITYLQKLKFSKEMEDRRQALGKKIRP